MYIKYIRTCNDVFILFVGVVPANGEVSIDVVFSPIDYSTTSMELKVHTYIIAIVSMPVVCTVTYITPPSLHYTPFRFVG